MKYHSNLQKENPSDVMIVFEKIDPKEDLVIEDLTIGQEKSTKQYVQIVTANAKYHSNPQKGNQYIAKIVSQTTEIKHY